MAERSHEDWHDILAFHLEAGVDVAVGEAPVDRFAESAAEAARLAARRASAAAPTEEPARRDVLRSEPARAAP
ncbi:uracil-DNA glycosylase, partial [Xanthobacter tagetidis]